MLLLALSFLIAVTVESACDGRFEPVLSKHDVQPLQNGAKQVEIISILRIWAKKHQKCSILEAKVDCFLTAFQAPTTSRGDLAHKSAVMYYQIRAMRLIVEGKILLLAYCCWQTLLLFCC